MARIPVSILLSFAFVPTATASDPTEDFVNRYVAEARRWQQTALPNTHTVTKGKFWSYARMDEAFTFTESVNWITIASHTEAITLDSSRSDKPSGSYSPRAELYRTDGRYSLTQKPGSDEWLLTTQPTPGTSVDPFQNEWILHHPYVGISYFTPWFGLTPFWKTSNMTVSSERDEPVHDRKQTVVKLHTPPRSLGATGSTDAKLTPDSKPRDTGESTSTHVFDRTDGWLPLRYEQYLHSLKVTMVWEFTYSTFEGRKVLKTVQAERRLDSGVVYPLADLEYEYESYSPEKSDFSLEQFGLPDLPEYQKPKPQQRYGMWILVGGTALVMLALTLRTLRTRLKKQAAPNDEPKKQGE